LEEIQSIIEKVRFDIQEGRPEREILPMLILFLGKNPETADRIIEELSNYPSLQMAHLLQSLLENPWDKKVRKTIRRSLYRMKSRGITVEEVLPDREGPVFRPKQAEPARGFGGPYDFLGQRFLMLAIPHMGRGLNVLQGIISDIEGLVDCSSGEMARKGFKLFFEEVQKGSPFPLIEMEPSYVGFLFDQAYHLTLAIGKTPPQDFLHLRGEIARIKKEYERPLIYSHFQENGIEGDDLSLRRGSDLIKIDLFNSWKLREEEIRTYANQVWEAEESKLFLNQAQKEARFQEIYQKALSELFTEEKRLIYQKRMEEMAYYLLKTKREEEARISLAVAIDLKKAPNRIQPNPFLFQLVVKSIFTFLSEAYEKKRNEFSLIAKP